MSDNTSPTVFCVSSSLALFLHPVLGLTGFFTQLGTYWFLHPAWDLLISSFFTQSWDLLVPSPRLGTYWFLVSSPSLGLTGFFTQLGTY